MTYNQAAALTVTDDEPTFPSIALPDMRAPRPPAIEALLAAQQRIRDMPVGGDIAFPAQGSTAAASQTEALSLLFLRYHGYLPESMWLGHLSRLLDRGAAMEAQGAAIEPAERASVGGFPMVGTALSPSAIGRYMHDAMVFTFGSDGVQKMATVPGFADTVLRPIVSSIYAMPCTVDRIVDVLSLAAKGSGEGMAFVPDYVARTPMQALAHTAVFVADHMGDVNRVAVQPHMPRAWAASYAHAATALPHLPDRALIGGMALPVDHRIAALGEKA